MKTFAPGRINLLGEHTDYNDGYVLPTVLDLGTEVSLTDSETGRVHVLSQEAHDLILGPKEYSFELGKEQKTGGWTDFVEGLFALARARGLETGPVQIHLSSDLPIGAGLSSSASLLIALIRALGLRFHWELSPLERIKLAQSVENQWVGAQVGILDPLAIEVGVKGKAHFIDTENPMTSFEAISLPSDFEVAVFHTGIAHRLSEGGYNQRRSECESAAQSLGFKTLREFQKAPNSSLSSMDFQKLPPVLQKRVMHVWNENTRVREAVSALKASNLQKLGLLWKESHESLSHLFEVSLPEVDDWVALASKDPEVYGARMTGGGFGGAILILTHAGSAERVAIRIKDLARNISNINTGRLLAVVRGISH
jgi:galactokinase